MSTGRDGGGAGSEGDESRVCPLSGMVGELGGRVCRQGGMAGELGLREMKAGYVDREGW